MLLSLALSCGIVTTDDASPTAEEQAAYRSASAEAGRDAEAHVKLALWCERHGMDGERLKHLALALLADPANATARGLMGLVRDDDGWRKPEQVVDRVAADAALSAALAEYNARRAAAPKSAVGQFTLARWCEKHGLVPEAEAHYSTVVRIDPSRSDAWRALGCKPYKGRWLTDMQIQERIAAAKSQKEANLRWGRELGRIRDDMRSKKADVRDHAEAELSAVVDPLAVPAVWHVFVASKSPDLVRAIQVFAQIDAPTASAALAQLSVHADAGEVRRAAAENLRWRDRREFLDDLIASIRKPLKYELRPIDAAGSGVELYVEGVRFDLRRVYRAPEPPRNPDEFFDPYFIRTPGDAEIVQRGLLQRQQNAAAYFGFGSLDPALAGLAADPAALASIRSDPSTAASALVAAAAAAPPREPSLPPAQTIAASGFNAEINLQRREEIAARNRTRFQNAVQETHRQLAADIAVVEATNDSYHELNARVLPTLVGLTGEDYDADPIAWSRWWVDAQGYSYSSGAPKPTFVEVIPPLRTGFERFLSSSCFAAGTPVRTLTGVVPIEAVAVGDRVLTQDPETGGLSYQPVVATYHNRPASTLKLGIGGEPIVSTPIHRFWRPGEGWVMARDLKVGDTIRTVGGLARVESIEPDAVIPVFNLEVAENSSYFVGQAGFLVHDYTVVRPVATPFDATPTLNLATAE